MMQPLQKVYFPITLQSTFHFHRKTVLNEARPFSPPSFPVCVADHQPTPSATKDLLKERNDSRVPFTNQMLPKGNISLIKGSYRLTFLIQE